MLLLCKAPVICTYTIMKFAIFFFVSFIISHSWQLLCKYCRSKLYIQEVTFGFLVPESVET